MEGRWDRPFFMGFIDPSKGVGSGWDLSGEGEGPMCDAYRRDVELVKCPDGDHHGF